MSDTDPTSAMYLDAMKEMEVYHLSQNGGPVCNQDISNFGFECDNVHSTLTAQSGHYRIE